VLPCKGGHTFCGGCFQKLAHVGPQKRWGPESRVDAATKENAVHVAASPQAAVVAGADNVDYDAIFASIPESTFSVAAAAAPAAPAATGVTASQEGSGTITEEQRLRIERNRAVALERRRAKRPSH
jgi:hypothetical protein